MVIIAILAGLAVPKYREWKHRYYKTTMITDLRNLAITQESYWHDQDTYASDLATLQFTSSPGVTITIVTSDAGGWSATATHANDASTCSIFYGTAPPLAPAVDRSVAECN